LAFEETFGAAHTGIGLKRNATEPLKDLDALVAAELIPDVIGEEGSEDRKKKTDGEV
jgi:hypothetical protein